MSKAVILTSFAAGAALMGAGYLGRRAVARAPRLTGIIPIITPYIDIETAEGVLAVMEHLPDDRVTIVLHTLGGCVTACVLIANALRQFRDSTAVVPYMAISGGTLIALSATRLEMGSRASLSAVDPQIMGQRVKHLAESKDKPSIAALAREYDVSMRKYVRGALGEHLPEDRLGPAMDLFLGEHSPHEWPIQRPEIEALGIAVTPAASKWAAMVDSYRGRAW
jgi:pimeloyl-ACP methyl ester carboxylesterase